MKKTARKEKTAWGQYIGLGFFVLIGAACGFIMMAYMDACMHAGRTLGETLPEVALLIAGMYAAIAAQLILHEAGHLAFGLMTGYRFCSFRVFSLIWVKIGGRIRLRRLSIAGTGGQCLMGPPEMKDGKIPMTLYNLGGSIMNLLTGAAALAAFSAALQGMGAALLLVTAAVGLGIALMNGIPLHMGVMDNDGMNVVTLRRDAEAMRSFWIQMKVNELQTQGVRLRDMPEAWFALPEKMDDAMTAALGVLACNRLMDAHQFDAAAALMARMTRCTAMAGVHRAMMACDMEYIALITRGKAAQETARTAAQQKIMKQMKDFPSVLRIEYACALLKEGDRAGAERISARFEKLAGRYPYPGDVQSERELMDIAARAALEKADEYAIIE